LDEQMSSMNGLSVAKKIRKNQDWDNLKIIMLSSWGGIHSKKIKDLDVSMAVTKPVKQSRLFDIIMETLRVQDKPVTGEKSKPATVTQSQIRNLDILLVEDTPDNQRLVTFYLEKAGYSVNVAENGSEAVSKADNFHYDLILMDIQMPVMDGFEATGIIRQNEIKMGRDRTPIVGLTAHAVQGYREKCIEQGMDDYITKPIKKKVLIETIDKWTDKRHGVLVVDDSTDNRNLIKHYLKNEPNIRAEFAENGLVAVEKALRKRYALILIDMEMPVMDGYTATEKIRSSPKIKQVPIIALTARQGDQEIKKCLDVGCTAYLIKPIRKKGLIETIGQYIQISAEPQKGDKDG